MIPIQLYEHQEWQLNKLREALKRSRNVLLQSPTGSGKTVMGSYILNGVVSQGNCAFFIVHRKELVDQAAQTFDKYGLSYGYIAAGYPNNYYAPIQICSIDTLKNRIEKIPLVPKLCLWDEAHHIAAEGWMKVHKMLPHSFHVGLTATPERLDGKGLGMVFDELVLGKSVAWLIENGFLSDYNLFSITGVDRDSIAKNYGDFSQTEAAKAMSKGFIIGDIIKHWKEKADGRKTIGFASTIDQSKNLVMRLNEAGIRSAHLDANSGNERRSILRDLAMGRLDVVFNVGLFGEGYDIAANSGMDVTIQCLIDASPTQSLSKWLQRCGRVLRKSNEKAVILDHAGNWVTHGSPCEDREWSLMGGAGEKRKKKLEEDETAVKFQQCEKCFFCYETNKPYKDPCPNCGTIKEPKKREIKHKDDLNLEEVDLQKERMRKKQEQGKAKTKEDLVNLATQRGYKLGFADHVQAARNEKQELRNRLLNLSIAAKKLSIDSPSNKQILEMKPKALREMIATLENAIRND